MMKMIHFLMLAVLVAHIHCLEKSKDNNDFKRLRFIDCGREDSIVTFEHFDAQPSPVQMPGIIRLILRANFSSQPPEDARVRVILRKKMAHSGWVRIPCFFGIGSCDYEHLPTCLFTQELFGCPIMRKLYNINDSFLLTKPGDFLSPKVIQGDYQALVRVYHLDTHKQLACLAVQFSLVSSQ